MEQSFSQSVFVPITNHLKKEKCKRALLCFFSPFWFGTPKAGDFLESSCLCWGRQRHFGLQQSAPDLFADEICTFVMEGQSDKVTLDPLSSPSILPFIWKGFVYVASIDSDINKNNSLADWFIPFRTVDVKRVSYMEGVLDRDVAEGYSFWTLIVQIARHVNLFVR